MKRIILYSLIVLVLILPGSASQAASGATLEYSGVSIPTDVCADSYGWIVPRIVLDSVDETEDGVSYDWQALIAFDGDGVPLDVDFSRFDVALGVMDIYQQGYWAYEVSHGLSRGGLNDITARPITVELYDIPAMPGQAGMAAYEAVRTTGTKLATLSYDLLPLIAGCSELPLRDTGTLVYDIFGRYTPESVAFMAAAEERPGLDTQSANLLVIPQVVTSTGDIGSPAPDQPESVQTYQIWGINEEGQGYLAFVVDEPALNELPPTPENPITVAESEGGEVALYKLPSGEYSLQIGPDEEGKVQVVIMDAIPPTETRREDWNIYDVE